MKHSICLFAVLIIVFAVFTSCKKEYSCEDCVNSNKPPLAVAGNDTTIFLPLDSLVVNGSMSTDPEGSITEWQWSKISGPSSFTITHANAAVTSIANLGPGAYCFRLRVTDAGGLYDEDTIQIQVLQTQGTGNLYFFFRDSSGSLDAQNIRVIEYFPSVVNLAKVTIAGYPDAEIQGVWCLNYTPICPILNNYADMTSYGSFTSLPPGTYSWSAQSVTTNLTPYTGDVPAGFISYWSTPHYASGTVTVPPGIDCIIKEIDF